MEVGVPTNQYISIMERDAYHKLNVLMVNNDDDIVCYLEVISAVIDTLIDSTS